MVKWVECPRCTHKLFRLDYQPDSKARIEIKCSSCKKIIDILIDADINAEWKRVVSV